MKKVLCLLVLAAFVAQILARPGDDPKPKPEDVKDKVAKAGDEAEAKAKAEVPAPPPAPETPKKDSAPKPPHPPIGIIAEMAKKPMEIGMKAVDSGSEFMTSLFG